MNISQYILRVTEVPRDNLFPKCVRYFVLMNTVAKAFATLNVRDTLISRYPFLEVPRSKRTDTRGPAGSLLV